MDWKNFLAKLRQKPAEEKTVILWTAVIVCMAVIFVFWLVSLNFSLKESLGQKENNPTVSLEAASEIKKLKNDLPTLWQSLTAGLSDILNFKNPEIKYESDNPAASVENPSQEILPVE